MTTAERVLRLVNNVPSLLAYWDVNERCIFANETYRSWFNRNPDEMVGIHLKDVLGPVYEQNLPYVRAVLRGEPQSFERQHPLANGKRIDVIATYIPDMEQGQVVGFFVTSTDVTILRERETALAKALKERDEALTAVRTLEGLLPICAGCKSIRDEDGHWHGLEDYVSGRADVSFSHGMCPHCMKKWYPSFD